MRCVSSPLPTTQKLTVGPSVRSLEAEDGGKVEVPPRRSLSELTAKIYCGDQGQLRQ